MKEMQETHPLHSNDLHAIAQHAMTENGLEPEFPADALRQLQAIPGPAQETDAAARDLRDLLWCSIDNDHSRDLDQLSVAQKLSGDVTRIMIAIADVDALVPRNTPIDQHARTNTTSVYTAARIFSMLPERLSTDLTSLNEKEDRLALVIAINVAADGKVQESEVYRAMVRNHAKLAYRSVAEWLDGLGPMPEKVRQVEGMAEQLHLQDQVAQSMKANRHQHGALDLETIEPEAVMTAGKVVDLRLEKKNRAKDLIEDFMIATNGVTAAFLESHHMPSLRRVVRAPERWDRIREVAQRFHDELPVDPDARALAIFLAHRHQADPLRFPDLSLTIVKLMGAGEYVLQLPGQEPVGHFGLAVRDYNHSTAPNRRYPDLVTQRLVKAALTRASLPYTLAELTELASHCTKQEDAAKKVERQVLKSAAAQLLSSRIGETFDALVTGSSAKGTWVRLLAPPVEGRLMHDSQGIDVGDPLKVHLASVNVERGFIDFVRAR